MLRKQIIAGVAAIGLLALASGAANASMVQWNFHGNGSGNDSDGGNVEVGSTETYKDQSACTAVPPQPVSCTGVGLEIVAAGFETDDGFESDYDSEHLVENNRGGIEDGLGVKGRAGEIDKDQLIRLDLDGLDALVDWQVMFNSIDGDEIARLYTSDDDEPDISGLSAILSITAGTAGANTAWFDFDPMRYVFVGPTGGPSGADVLLKAIRATERASVPEPATLALLGLGLLGIGFARRHSAARG